jgi:hypothetical protein
MSELGLRCIAICGQSFDRCGLKNSDRPSVNLRGGVKTRWAQTATPR